MFKYRSSIDRTSAVIVTADGIVLETYVNACYGSMFYGKILTALAHPDAQFMDVYYNDSITEFYKGDTTNTLRYIQTMQEVGLFKNTEVTIVLKEDVPHTIIKNKDVSFYSTHILKIRHDIDKASAQEMFLIGNCIRTVAIYPEVVSDYLQLLDLEPTIDKWKLWIITQAMTLNPKREMMNGHKLGTNYFNLVSDYSLEDFYKRSEHKIPLRTSKCYQLYGSVQYDDLFVNNSVPCVGDDIYSTRYGSTSKYKGIPKRQGVLYSKEALETFFDKDKLMASICTPAYSLTPYTKQTALKEEPKPYYGGAFSPQPF